MPGGCIKTGCCGFPFSMKKYFEFFRLVEVQKTFYRIPDRKVLERWRSIAPPDFEFTVKAWQIITHPHTSPTWRKAGIRMSEEEARQHGFLKPTLKNLEAWSRTVEAAEILEAKIIVLQTPPSFGYSEKNMENAIMFFKEARRIAPHIVIAWEPRGPWHERREELEKILRETGVVHVVDVLRRQPIILPSTDILYTRLHGLGGRETNYRYKYSTSDLERLLSTVSRYLAEQVSQAYVLFNNVYMGEDALRFAEMIASRKILC